MSLVRCTLTGVDASTNIDALIELSNMYPFVEWGLLYSKKQKEEARYLTDIQIYNIVRSVPSYVKLAIHVCGSAVRDLVQDDFTTNNLVKLFSSRGHRTQLNFNLEDKKISALQVIDYIVGNPRSPIITQVHNEKSQDVLSYVSTNHHLLFDKSGGNGISPKEWPQAFTSWHCGYAGGLGLDNLKFELPKIEKASNNHSYWIDMESKLRSDKDTFDLDTCMQILEHCAVYMEDQKLKKQNSSLRA